MLKNSSTEDIYSFWGLLIRHCFLLLPVLLSIPISCGTLVWTQGENPLLIVCDEITDHHNLGAIIRTAECAGAHGVIIPKRRSAGLTAVVAKTSAGAVTHVPVARVPNIPSLLKDLKSRAFGCLAQRQTVPPTCIKRI